MPRRKEPDEEDLRPGSAYRLHLALTDEARYVELLNDNDLQRLLMRLGRLRGLEERDMDEGTEYWSPYKDS